MAEQPHRKSPSLHYCGAAIHTLASQSQQGQETEITLITIAWSVLE